MDYIKAIEARRSVRTYTGQPLSAETKAKIMQHASSLTNPFDAKQVEIGIIDRAEANAKGEKLGTYGTIRGARTFLCLAVADRAADIMAGGYMMEDLILYATSEGLGTVWLGGTFKRKSFARAVNLAEGMILPAVCAIGEAAERSLVEKLTRLIAKADHRKPWRELFFDCYLNQPLSESAAAEYAEPLEMLRLAPSATNTQPWRMVKIGETFHFYAQYKSGISAYELRMRHLDMGIALAHFVLSAQQLKLPARVSVSDPRLPYLPKDYHYCYTVNACCQ